MSRASSAFSRKCEHRRGAIEASVLINRLRGEAQHAYGADSIAYRPAAVCHSTTVAAIDSTASAGIATRSSKPAPIFVEHSCSPPFILSSAGNNHRRILHKQDLDHYGKRPLRSKHCLSRVRNGQADRAAYTYSTKPHEDKAPTTTPIAHPGNANCGAKRPMNLTTTPPR